MQMLWWILAIVWIVFGLLNYHSPDDLRWRGGGNAVLIILLLMLAYLSIGWPFK